MTFLRIPRSRVAAVPFAHNSQCGESPSGRHIRHPARLFCLCCRCRLTLSAQDPTRETPVLGDGLVTRAMLPYATATVRLALAQAQKLGDASIEGSPAEFRYNRLSELLELALSEITATDSDEVLS